MYSVDKNIEEPDENSLVLIDAKGKFEWYNQDAKYYGAFNNTFNINIDVASEYKYMIIFCDMFWDNPTRITFTNNLNTALMCVGGIWGKNRFSNKGELFRREGSYERNILYYKDNIFKNKNIVIESFTVSKRGYFFKEVLF